MGGQVQSFYEPTIGALTQRHPLSNFFGSLKTVLFLPTKGQGSSQTAYLKIQHPEASKSSEFVLETRVQEVSAARPRTW